MSEITWTSPPLFNFRASRKELVERFGPPHVTDADSNGMGAMDVWLLRFECGLETAVWQFQCDALGVPVANDDAPRLVEIHANQREIHHLAFHAGVDERVIDRWLPDATHVGEPSWNVVRQDDNGNRFVVDSFTSRCEAEAAVVSYTSLGHKQLYWAEPV